MTWLVVLYLSIQPTPTQAHALAAWSAAPRDLTVERAEAHIAAARFAGDVYDVDPYLLLGIAHHESLFHEDTVTREPPEHRGGRHRVSCGPMTPVPERYCAPGERTVAGGYLAGARHLRWWIDAYHGDVDRALVAYVGGSGLVKWCARHSHFWVRRGVDACDVGREFRRRARAIRVAMEAV